MGSRPRVPRRRSDMPERGSLLAYTFHDSLAFDTLHLSSDIFDFNKVHGDFCPRHPQHVVQVCVKATCEASWFAMHSLGPHQDVPLHLALPLVNVISNSERAKVFESPKQCFVALWRITLYTIWALYYYPFRFRLTKLAKLEVSGHCRQFAH